MQSAKSVDPCRRFWVPMLREGHAEWKPAESRQLADQPHEQYEDLRKDSGGRKRRDADDSSDEKRSRPRSEATVQYREVAH